MVSPKHDESEQRTRGERIDPRLDAAGWPLPRGATPLRKPYRTEELPTDNGPADYALWLDNHVVALVEAKKLTAGPQNVLTQAERYARGLRGGPYNFNGLRAPFLYSTNGEVIWFHSQLVRSQILKITMGVAQPKVSLERFKTIALPLPPLPEQQEIVRRVEALFALADRIEARAAKAKAHLDRLTPSLLAKAFRGDLVPTEADLARQEGRDYESASVLLERIKAERTSAGGKKPRRKPTSTRTKTAAK